MTVKKTTSKTRASLTITAVGRRKRAVARVRLNFKKGEWLVNGTPIQDYFKSKILTSVYAQPLRLAQVEDRVGFQAKIIGGGVMAQIGALNHALARALSKYDTDKFRSIMKTAGFLTRDPREKERRKPGQGGKARRKRQSPKR